MTTQTLTAPGSDTARAVQLPLGTLLVGGPTAQPTTVDASTLLALLADRGVVLLRGFGFEVATFTDLVQRTSGRTSLDPARTFAAGGVAQAVDAGTDAVGLHLENGNSPIRPHLTWFLCSRPATVGSQTTVCDGRAVWDLLPPALRSRFAETDIVYQRTIEPGPLNALASKLSGTPVEGPAAVKAIASSFDEPDRVELDVAGDGSLTYRYRTPAVHPTLFSAAPAFAHSICGPSYNYKPPIISFADNGDVLDPELLAMLSEISESVTHNIDWEEGDVALIDNTRVMHGRRPIEDDGRKIFNALSYLPGPPPKWTADLEVTR